MIELTSLPHIAFSGAKKSGKTTSAKYLAEKYGFKNCSFATPLKITLFDILYDLTHNPEKEEPTVILNAVGLPYPPVTPEEELHADDAKIAWVNQNKDSLRQYLQRIGTEYFRFNDNNYWINKFIDILDVESPDTRFTIDDCRYENEAEELLYNGFVIVNIVRPGLPDDGDTHASETESEQWLEKIEHYEIVNNGSIHELNTQLDELMNELVHMEEINEALIGFNSTRKMLDELTQEAAEMGAYD